MTDSGDNTEHNAERNADIQESTGSQDSQDQDEACLEEDNEESLEETENDSYLDFLSTFYRAKGAIHIIMIACLLSLGVGCTIGVVPGLMADRYARLRHGFDGDDDCSSFDRIDKPVACQQGSDDAQHAAAMATLAKYIFTLCFNSILGGLSDVRGRRVVLILSTFLAALSPIVLVLMQTVPTMDPVWFYASHSAVGVVNYISVCFAALSDVVPPKYRTAGFGLFLGSVYLWFSLAPSLPLFMTHYHASLFSCLIVAIAFIYTVVALPETLPQHVAERNNRSRRDAGASRTLLQVALSPLLSLSILNRTTALRLVAVGSFLSGIVYSSDTTLAIYYMEDQLNVRDSDLARMFIVRGLVGVLIQSFLLKFLISMMGEKRLLVVTFCSGAIHNLCYGLAKTKGLLYVALALSQLTKTNFPILSSIVASNVNTYEQGQIQGALFALSALANALGPMALQRIYQCTKDSTNPGTMFVVAALLYLIGTVCVSFVPSEKHQQQQDNSIAPDLEEPLLLAAEGNQGSEDA